MPQVSDILRMRERRSLKRRPSHNVRNISWLLAALLSITLALLSITVALFYNSLTTDLPSLASLPMLLDAPAGQTLTPTRLYDRTGEHVLLTLENPAGAGARPLAYDSFPLDLINAVTAASDPTFWSHPGFTSLTPSNLDPSQTLAESLVLNTLLWNEPPSPRRTFRTKILAGQLVTNFGRKQILEWHLNTADFGHLTFGVDAAAHVYFDKPVAQLTLAESALLAAVGAAPDLNPFDAPALALDGMRQVLEKMADTGLITAAEAEDASEQRLSFRDESPLPESLSPAFTNLVLSQLSTQFNRDRLLRGGLRVITTLDVDLQAHAQCASATQLALLSDLQPEECPAARLLPTLLDSGDIPSGLNAEVVLLSPATGQLLALVGPGESLDGHPPGSLLAPYVYLSAFTRGFSPASLLWDVPSNLPPTTSLMPNPDGAFHGPVRMRTALANDYLVPAMTVLAQLGSENVWRTARQIGWPSLNISAGLESQNLLLEGGSVTLLEAVHGYSMFSNQGVWIGQLPNPQGDPSAPLTAITYLRVEDLEGNILLDPPRPVSRPVTTAQLAFLLTHILSDEPARWPSLGHPNPLEIGLPAAAKLGQTADGQNAWTVGFTPDVVVGVWVGVDQGEEAPMAGRVPPQVAAGVWHALMKSVGQDYVGRGWQTPEEIRAVDVCDSSGLLPTLECANIVTELFLPGTEPTQIDTLYQKFQINRETGLLATVFTPPELIEERVYLVPPPEAAGWAQTEGLPVPPEAYDLVSGPGFDSPDAQIDGPQMFDYVKGAIAIRGSATGSGFQEFRVQVGQGLNPQQWIQLGDAGTNPVESDILAEWDTTGLSGLYAIRLLVVDDQQRIQTSITQVTIDNSPPVVGIENPTEDATFTYPLDNRVTFQVSANDDLALASVEVFLDNQIFATFTQPPYAVPWEVRPGEYTLRVVAIDLAGNESVTELKFSVVR